MKRNELLKIIIMKILKTTSLKSDFKFKVKKEEKGDVIEELVHPGFKPNQVTLLDLRKLQTH
jgi:hypothetical protein